MVEGSVEQSGQLVLIKNERSQFFVYYACGVHLGDLNHLF